MLPKVELERSFDPGFDNVKKEYSMSEYQELIEKLKEFIGSDCWGLTVNDDVIFDSYLDNSKSIRLFIEEDVIRDKILNDPHGRLLVYLHRRQSNSRIRIYMSYTEPWTINIDFVYSDKKFYIYYSKQ